MKIVIAPNEFKGSLSARDAAAAMAKGAKQACPGADIVCIPFSDGGDGLVEVMADVLGGELEFISVTGPRFERLEAPICTDRRSGLIAVEMARASGLALLDPLDRDPRQTTTQGTGELMAYALSLEPSRIVVGIGGSATNDGGIGMAAALGFRFLDSKGRPVSPVGGNLKYIDRIDSSKQHPALDRVSIEVVCDVDNPLLGPHGAARVYGPQKGADSSAVLELEQGLAHLADIIERDLGIEVRDLPGSGAAGGLGAGLSAFAGARLRRGVEVMIDLLGLRSAMADADLALTAEGQLDEQISYGKGPAGVSGLAQEHSVPCVVLAGSVQIEHLPDLPSLGIQAAFSICPGPVSLETAMSRAGDYLEHTAEQAVRLFLAGRRSSQT